MTGALEHFFRCGPRRPPLVVKLLIHESAIEIPMTHRQRREILTALPPEDRFVSGIGGPIVLRVVLGEWPTVNPLRVDRYFPV